jgi:hypothetical protein
MRSPQIIRVKGREPFENGGLRYESNIKTDLTDDMKFRTACIWMRIGSNDSLL